MIKILYFLIFQLDKTIIIYQHNKYVNNKSKLN